MEKRRRNRRRTTKLCGYLCAVCSQFRRTPPPPFPQLPSAVLAETPQMFTSPPKRRALDPIGKTESSIPKRRRLSRSGGAELGRSTDRLAWTEVECGSREVRAVVLVDVYLPIALWSGWQFPRSSSIAAALFKHLSCDWGARSLMLKSVKSDGDDYYSIWNVTDCHVLGCRRHCSAPDNLKKQKLFELQEIFKSLPCVTKKVDCDYSRVKPAVSSCESGIWVLSDDILINILTTLSPIDLVKISLACRHLRFLAASIMPCMKLKLYPHQQAAVEWMLQREKESKVLKHPLYMNFRTADGFDFNINMVSGEIVAGIVPTIRDFRGGMFCDEPGLGKTITAISLILKTQGTLAEPPDAVQVIWCMHDGNQRCGYYEAHADNITKGNVSNIKNVHKVRRGQLCLDELTPKNIFNGYESKSPWLLGSREQIVEPTDSCSNKRIKVCEPACSTPATISTPSSRSWSNARRNLLAAYKEPSFTSQRCSENRKHAYKGDKQRSPGNQVGLARRISFTKKRDNETVTDDLEYNETWVQCDACSKWRKESITLPTRLPRQRGPLGPGGEHIIFCIGVLKEHYTLLNSETKKALTWLAKLSPGKLAEMETTGIALCEPLDSLRLYLSSATLIVVPSNLVDHWRTQIERHVRPGQLRVYIWGDQKKKPSGHCLAWDYDVVITTFNRLSAEWGPHKRSVLMQVHWLRVVLDEGHTLGSSLNLTNKLQMAVSLTATNRWLLTGTPTPNTPNSQLSYLQPMLKFLKEETYGQHQKSWEAGIVRPFEAEMEEGRSRLLQLLHRCMISARK
ncbi:F-box protein [Sesamum alatum]|uniref:F-box protein n=1 Tax=Sesamum alatum TaxID=300844 RepID=A0AAE2CA35_9LAMI|nr:F-box protein [Sesamum alatum]